MTSIKIKVCIFAALCFPSIVSADVSMELKNACYGDIELTDYIVLVAKGESAPPRVVSEVGAGQIATLLSMEENAGLDLKDKYEAVMQACIDGRILQDRNQHILNQN
ncbi:MAG: hypothetical protein AAF431_17605 [Pseudomonadota bacterium]